MPQSCSCHNRISRSDDVHRVVTGLAKPVVEDVAHSLSCCICVVEEEFVDVRKKRKKKQRPKLLNPKSSQLTLGVCVGSEFCQTDDLSRKRPSSRFTSRRFVQWIDKMPSDALRALYSIFVE